MHLFLIAAEHTPSERWSEAFPECRVQPPPFPEQLPAGVQLVWVSTAITDWPAVVAVWVQRARVVVHSLLPTDDQALDAFAAGAHGYCHSLANVALLRAVAATVAAGGLWLGPGVLGRVVRGFRSTQKTVRKLPPENFGVLTVREREVALAVTSGATNKEIAQQLGLTERTVKMHLGSIFRKLGVRDRLHLVLLLTHPEGAATP